MELKHYNLNGKIVLENKPNLVMHFFGKIVKIALKNEFYKLFIQKDALRKMLRLPK